MLKKLCTLTDKHWYCRNAERAFLLLLKLCFFLVVRCTTCPFLSQLGLNPLSHLHNQVLVPECKWLPPFVPDMVYSFETACFFHTLIRSRPHALVKGTCASHVCNICLQFAKHLCGMEAACLSSGQRVSAVYPHSCILGLVECWNADLQSVHWERGCASEPAQTGSSLWSFRIYSRRNTNRNTISRSWPVVVITLITLICAHDCRRHLIYKPHWTEKVAIVTTAQ